MKYLFTLLLIGLSTLLIHANVIYVNVAAVGNNDGSSWSDAFTDMQDAIDLAISGDELWIAQGTYFPTTDNNRYVYFELHNGVKWFGGFNGTETSLAQQDPTAYVSLLSGDIGIEGDSTDNSFTVVYTAYTDSTTLIDGFTIGDGNADSDLWDDAFEGPAKSGAGLFVNASGIGGLSTVRVEQCVFKNNAVRHYGGAVYCKGANGGSAIPKIEHCTFIDNTSLNSGGALFRDGGTEDDFRLSNLAFYNNSAFVGGAINFNCITGDGIQLIDSCLFVGNTSVWGGAAFFYEDFNQVNEVLVKNSDFFENKSLTFGHCIYVGGYNLGGDFETDIGDFEIDNCNFIGNGDSLNSASNFFFEYGFFNDTLTVLISISNSTIKENFTGASFSYSSSQPLDYFIRNCSITDNVNSLVTGIGGGESRLVVENSLIARNTVNTEGYIFGISSSTLEVNNSIVWGNRGPNGIELNYLKGHGTALFQNSLVDVPDCQSLNPFNDPIEVDCMNMLYNQYPEFVDTSSCDYRLLPCSPAVNAGDNSLVDTVSVTDLSGNPRISEVIVDLGPYETLPPLSIESIQDILCNGANDGAVNFNFENGSLPLSYEWENVPTTGIGNTNLGPGDYLFTVTDATGCSRSIDLSINEVNDVQLVTTISNATGPTQMDGSIVIGIINGGTAPYLYNWSNGSAFPGAFSLMPGDYSLTIVDANGCEYIFEFVVGFTIDTHSPVQELAEYWVRPNIIERSGALTFYLKSQMNGRVELSLINSIGAVVERYVVEKSAAAVEVELMAPDVAGVYFLRVKVDGNYVGLLTVSVL